MKRPVIIMGADNSHPAQGEGNRPSITAIVGSLDRHATRYGTQISVQKTDGKRTHSFVIENIGTQVKNTLIKFYQSWAVPPRDDVRSIRNQESLHLPGSWVQPPDNLCGLPEATPHPALLCEPPRCTGSEWKCTRWNGRGWDITSPVNFDFYLNSHQGIQAEI
eukprot:sb/3472663/